MPKREWGAESNRKLPHLLIPSETAALVPEFAMEDLPLGRIAALVPEFAVKDLSLGRTLMMMMMMIYVQYIHINPSLHFILSFSACFVYLSFYDSLSSRF